jgi:HPt (histidine-containing phosphotransfer) domain-containing protein
MDDLPILDRARLDLATRGNAALADEFLGALFEEAGDLIVRLGALMGGDERLAVADAAHTLKGMATELGAMRLRAAAAALEAELRPLCWPENVERVAAALAELQAFNRNA